MQTNVGEPLEEATPLPFYQCPLWQRAAIRGAGDEQSHVFKCSKGQPMSNQGRAERVDTGLPSLTPTWAHACCLAGWPLEGSATTSIAPLRRFQEGAALGGLPRKTSWGGLSREGRNSNLGPRAPDVLRSPRGSAGTHPWPLCLGVGVRAPCLAPPGA